MLLLRRHCRLIRRCSCPTVRPVCCAELSDVLGACPELPDLQRTTRGSHARCFPVQQVCPSSARSSANQAEHFSLLLLTMWRLAVLIGVMHPVAPFVYWPC